MLNLWYKLNKFLKSVLPKLYFYLIKITVNVKFVANGSTYSIF